MHDLVPILCKFFPLRFFFLPRLFSFFTLYHSFFHPSFTFFSTLFSLLVFINEVFIISTAFSSLPLTSSFTLSLSFHLFFIFLDDALYIITFISSFLTVLFFLYCVSDIFILLSIIISFLSLSISLTFSLFFLYFLLTFLHSFFMQFR